MTLFARAFIEDRIWCAPTQDLQAQYQPAKLTGMNGAYRHLRVVRRDIPLPTKAHQYHVFQLGAMPKQYMGLNALPQETWVSFHTLINDHQVWVEGYTLHGVHLPKACCYLRKLDDNNVLIAVERLDRLYGPTMDLNTRPFLMRFYTNAWLAQQPTLSLRTEGRYIHDINDAIVLQNQYHAASLAYPGQVFGYVNGQRVTPFTVATIHVGTYAEFHVDPSVRRVDVLPIADLDTFLSTLDGVQKYILHHDHVDTGVIEYKDDLDVYLTRTQGGITQGVYVHQNRVHTLRMLTHRDYSVAVSDITAYLEALDWPLDLTKYTLQLTVRQGGRERHLVTEAHRIHELYKLPDDQIRQAFSGVHSTLPEWTADRLEQSAYPTLMGVRAVEHLTAADIERGLGYNLYSRIYGHMPVEAALVAGTHQFTLPPSGWGACLVLEYSSGGVLLGGHVKATSGTLWLAQHAQCRRIEVFEGTVSSLTNPVTRYNVHSGECYDGHEYGYYFCSTRDQLPIYDWSMADPEVDVLADEDGFGWLTLPELFYTAVRSDQVMTFYSTAVYSQDHVLEFTIGAYEQRQNAVSFAPVELPFAKLLVWLNGRRLIEGIDYHVQWPKVVVVNKTYLDTTSPFNTVHVLGFGLLDNTLTRFVSTERGFLKNHRISLNDRFEIRDDKVFDVVLDGKVVSHDRIVFDEKENQGTVLAPPNLPYATPYVIERLPIRLPFLETTDSLSYRTSAYGLDRRVSDVLTVKVPDTPLSTPVGIPERYNVISPFFCRILMDLRQGQLNISAVADHFAMASVSLSTIETWVAPYTYLLDFDPCRLGIVEGYMMIHPHGLSTPMDVTEKEYVLLIRLNHLYLNNKVEVHQTLRIVQEEAF